MPPKDVPTSGRYNLNPVGFHQVYDKGLTSSMKPYTEVEIGTKRSKPIAHSVNRL